MLFTCGIGIGLYFWGVAEPLVYYTQYPNLQKPFWNNADQRAQASLFMANFHWGLHGWVPYIVVAIALGLSCYKVSTCFHSLCVFFVRAGLTRGPCSRHARILGR